MLECTIFSYCWCELLLLVLLQFYPMDVLYVLLVVSHNHYDRFCYMMYNVCDSNQVQQNSNSVFRLVLNNNRSCSNCNHNSGYVRNNCYNHNKDNTFRSMRNSCNIHHTMLHKKDIHNHTKGRSNDYNMDSISSQKLKKNGDLAGYNRYNNC